MAVVFITAAASNTGKAIAEKFASEGYSVAVSSRNESDAIATAQYLEEKYSVQAKGYGLELTNVENIKQVFDKIKKDFGRLDTFVANAANLGVDMDFLSVDEQEYSQVVDCNLKGTFFCAQQAGLIMKEQKKGSIVFMSSVHSHECIFGRSLYTASKGGINALAKALAVDLGPFGIRVNVVLPGTIKTARWVEMGKKQIVNGTLTPIGDISDFEDVANAVWYLGTDMSKNVTGTELTVDGGMSIQLYPRILNDLKKRYNEENN